jgi:hypothetical protein
MTRELMALLSFVFGWGCTLLQGCLLVLCLRLFLRKRQLMSFGLAAYWGIAFLLTIYTTADYAIFGLQNIVIRTLIFRGTTFFNLSFLVFSLIYIAPDVKPDVERPSHES